MNAQQWFVYILRCADDSYYTGMTTDVGRRIEEHNGIGSERGARYTRSRRPVELVYLEPCRNRSEASQREYAIKRLSHRQKITLINRAE